MSKSGWFHICHELYVIRTNGKLTLRKKKKRKEGQTSIPPNSALMYVQVIYVEETSAKLGSNNK